MPQFKGDVYAATDLPTVPHSLEAANTQFGASSEARRLLGDVVVDHYHHFFASEVAAHQKAVTDWEHRRYFERI
ncbi:MAG: hypothetical protein AAEB43_00915 [Acidimicrobiales bacterium]